MDLLLSDAKGRLMQFQCDQGSLQVRRLIPDGRIPMRATQGSVGYDLFSPHDYVIPPFGKASIQTDIAVAVPSGTYACIAPPSGMALKSHIAVGAGVIDQDYRSGIGVVLFHHSDQSVEVPAGDRIAQIVLERIALPEVQEVDQLPDTQRGDKGFGSTRSSVRATTHKGQCPLYHIHALAAEELSLQPNVDTAHDTVSPFAVEVTDCTCQEDTASDMGSEDVGSVGTVSTCTSQPPDCFAGGWGYEREYESPKLPALESPTSCQQVRSRSP